MITIETEGCETELDDWCGDEDGGSSEDSEEECHVFKDEFKIGGLVRTKKVPVLVTAMNMFREERNLKEILHAQDSVTYKSKISETATKKTNSTMHKPPHSHTRTDHKPP